MILEEAGPEIFVHR